MVKRNMKVAPMLLTIENAVKELQVGITSRESEWPSSGVVKTEQPTVREIVGSLWKNMTWKFLKN